MPMTILDTKNKPKYNCDKNPRKKSESFTVQYLIPNTNQCQHTNVKYFCNFRNKYATVKI